MKPVVVLTTVSASFDVVPLARALVEQRLAACVNIVERISTISRWKGRVEDDAVQLLFIKTTDATLPDLKAALFANHPYEVPEFIVLDIDRIEGPYREWLLALGS
jgi:periplasmic divalent cation tolerance protein